MGNSLHASRAFMLRNKSPCPPFLESIAQFLIGGGASSVSIGRELGNLTSFLRLWLANSPLTQGCSAAFPMGHSLPSIKDPCIGIPLPQALQAESFHFFKMESPMFACNAVSTRSNTTEARGRFWPMPCCDANYFELSE